MLQSLLQWALAVKNGPTRYDDSFFSDEWFAGWAELKDVLAELLGMLPESRRVLDFGCGPGIMIDLMNDRGLHYVGCDFSPEARELYLKHFGRYPERYVLRLPDGEHFDLMVCMDVFEHMKDEEIAAVLGRVDADALLVNISRNRMIPGHINIKGDEAWIALLRGLGFECDQESTQALRRRYVELRPGAPDAWDANLFFFRRKAPESKA